MFLVSTIIPSWLGIHKIFFSFEFEFRIQNWHLYLDLSLGDGEEKFEKSICKNEESFAIDLKHTSKKNRESVRIAVRIILDRKK